MIDSLTKKWATYLLIYGILGSDAQEKQLVGRVFGASA